MPLPYVRHSVTFDEPVWGGELGFDWSAYSVHREIRCSPTNPNAPLTDIDLGPTRRGDPSISTGSGRSSAGWDTSSRLSPGRGAIST